MDTHAVTAYSGYHEIVLNIAKTPHIASDAYHSSRLSLDARLPRTVLEEPRELLLDITQFVASPFRSSRDAILKDSSMLASQSLLLLFELGDLAFDAAGVHSTARSILGFIVALLVVGSRVFRVRLSYDASRLLVLCLTLVVARDI